MQRGVGQRCSWGVEGDQELGFKQIDFYYPKDLMDPMDPAKTVQFHFITTDRESAILPWGFTLGFAMLRPLPGQAIESTSKALRGAPRQSFAAHQRSVMSVVSAPSVPGSTSSSSQEHS